VVSHAGAVDRRYNGTHLVSRGVLDAEPQERVDRGSRDLVGVHRGLEAGPALGDGTFLEVHGGADRVPVNLWDGLAYLQCGFWSALQTRQAL
jgi:hypothetical protein